METEEENPMAEPLRKDEPLSAMHGPESSSPVVVRDRPLLPENLPSRPLGEWPHADFTEAAISPVEDTRLLEAGEAIGAAIGAVVNEAREIPSWLQHRAHERISDLKRRFQVIRGKDPAEIPAEIKERAEELASEAEKTIAEVAREARREAMRWQFRARVYARRDPLGFVATAAVTGFAVGFLLRLWGNE